MIEIRINKDIGSYEAKFIGPLTMRQTICVCIALPICWFIYSVAAPVITTDVAGFLVLLPACAVWLFGWYKPYGLTTEKFLKSVFVNMVLAPSHRKYKTVNRQEKAFAVLEEAAKNSCVAEPHKQEKKKPKYKASPEAVR